MHVKTDDEKKRGVRLAPVAVGNDPNVNFQKPNAPKPGNWLLYIHSDLAFFTFGQPYGDFGAALQKNPRKWEDRGPPL